MSGSFGSYTPPAAPPPASEARLPAWLIGLFAGFATIVVVAAIGAAMVLIVNPIPGSEFARGEQLGRGVGPLAMLVGVVTGLSVHLARKRRDEAARAHGPRG